MANVRLLGHSWADDVALTVTSAEALLPKTNLQTRDVREVWRSTSTADQNIDMDFGASVSPTWLFLENLNNDGSMAIDVIMSNASDFTSPTYTSTATILAHQLPYWSAQHFFSSASGRYLRVKLKEAGNSDGYIECGRIKVGAYFDAPTSKNVEVGPAFAYRERAPLIELRGGGMHAQQKHPPRAVSVTWAWAHDTDNWTIEANSFADLLENVGYRDDLVISVYPGEGSDRELRHTFLGRMVDNSGLQGVELIKSGASVVLYSTLSITVRQSL